MFSGNRCENVSDDQNQLDQLLLTMRNVTLEIDKILLINVTNEERQKNLVWYYHHSENATALFNAEVYFSRIVFGDNAPIKDAKYYDKFLVFLKSEDALKKYHQYECEHADYEKRLEDFQTLKPYRPFPDDPSQRDYIILCEPLTYDMHTLKNEILKNEEIDMRRVQDFIVEKEITPQQLNVVIRVARVELSSSIEYAKKYIEHPDKQAQPKPSPEMNEQENKTINTKTVSNEDIAERINQVFESRKEAIEEIEKKRFLMALKLSKEAQKFGKQGNLPIYEALRTGGNILDPQWVFNTTKQQFNFADEVKMRAAATENDTPRGQIAQYLISKGVDGYQYPRKNGEEFNIY